MAKKIIKSALIKARVTEELKQKVEEYCELHVTTISALIRDAIEAYLASKN
jgi:predicted DNA-binding protein